MLIEHPGSGVFKLSFHGILAALQTWHHHKQVAPTCPGVLGKSRDNGWLWINVGNLALLRKRRERMRCSHNLLIGFVSSELCFILKLVFWLDFFFTFFGFFNINRESFENAHKESISHLILYTVLHLTRKGFKVF